MSSTPTPMQQLDPAELPLSGRHLIEASAGTGKTYNITRLFIRLIVERRLPVQRILVMTFTKAATEELRGRIDRELRNAVAHWGRLGEDDAFYKQMEARIDAARAIPLLESALLCLDEAAIYTIHGFCARVLRQHVLASDLPIEVEIGADTSEQALEAVRDWLRSVAHSNDYVLLSERSWHTPEGFVRTFGRAIRSRAELLAAEPEAFLQAARTEKGRVLELLLIQESEIVARLIDKQKEPRKRDNRMGEWGTLVDWLKSDGLSVPPKPAMDFVNGNRYRGDEELKAWLQPFKDLKSRMPKLREQAENAAAYPLVKAGVGLIRDRFAAAKRQQGLMDFDDLVARLADRVTSADGASLALALRAQYPIALVDEFQDTDHDQYAILERIYPRRVQGDAEQDAPALFMIGDPKQAIYAFRGGDVFTYLQAREAADDRWHMDTNWRSVPDMVTGYNRLFRGAPLDRDPKPVFGFGIDYEEVTAAKATQVRVTRLQDPATGEAIERRALNYVWFEPEEAGAEVNAPFRHTVAAWCCREIHRLLQQGRLQSDGESGRKVEDRDIAILVRNGTEAAIMQKALREADYPSVYLSARDNVFDSPEAAELALVLKGILACEESRPLIAASATHLLGGDAKHLANLADEADALATQRYRLTALRERWQREGFIPMMMALIHDHLAPPPQRHERCLTNHIHLAELLQQASVNLRHPQQLLEWLQDRLVTDATDSESELRLESDANLIRIVTQHGSKGLEYPIVFVPFSTYPKDPIKLGNKKQEFLVFHDSANRQPVQQIGSTEQADAAARAEGYAEAIRLLYVAVTRAEQRCYLGCAQFKHGVQSQLAKTLGLDSLVDGEPDWPKVLADLVADQPDCTALIRVPSKSVIPLRRHAPAQGDQDAVAARFDGRIERDWRISSFSALTRNLGYLRHDRKDHADDSDDGQIGLAELPLRFRLAKGAHAGNLLHDVLEHTDFSAPRWEESLREPLLRFGQLNAADRPHLEGWLQECLNTTLPPIGEGHGLQLAQLGWTQTLREVEFYFPMAGVQLLQLEQLLREHRGGDSSVELPGARRLEGMLHGYIDLVFEHSGRFYVADYKSTHLGNQLADYGLEALRANNEEHFYDLQYLLYAVALHRYLAVRLPAYDPASHFGGVYYLYLRGMARGSDSGVFHTTIGSELLQAMDGAFGESSPASSAHAMPLGG